MTEKGESGQPHPKEIFGRRVIEVCPECAGEGRLWECDEQFKSHSASGCKLCNCIGYILDMPLDYPEMDPDEIPF